MSASDRQIVCAKYENHNVGISPQGGSFRATGVVITWQNGPLRTSTIQEEKEPNGAFVETVLFAALQRLRHFQDTKFACRENAVAITKIEEAMHWLEARTKDRTIRGVEGTHLV